VPVLVRMQLSDSSSPLWALPVGILASVLESLQGAVREPKRLAFPQPSRPFPVEPSRRPGKSTR